MRQQQYNSLRRVGYNRTMASLIELVTHLAEATHSEILELGDLQRGQETMQEKEWDVLIKGTK